MQLTFRLSAASLAVLAVFSTIAPTGAAPIHTSHDEIPDLCASPTIKSVGNGPWSDPATWSPARVPTTDDAVRIAAGTMVRFDAQMTEAADCVGVAGQLMFDTTVPTRLWAGNVMVYAGSRLQIGTPEN